ncbi:hypothetical protein [Epibacterium ulvae]|nr:hypothetical protein [Epibacterium ulvae]
MIECGWGHTELMAMSEEEFCFWRDTRAEYDRLVAAAQKAAQQEDAPT